jgi:hypothetical protein
MTNNSKQILAKAIKKIDSANEELMKPHDAIVSYAVCNNSKVAIKLLLESYLIKNNFSIDKNESLALLLERCILIDKKFKSVDLSKINCRHNTTSSSYCSSVAKVSACYDTAREIELLIKN